MLNEYNKQRLLHRLVIATMLTTSTLASAAYQYKSPLESPATLSKLAADAPLIGVTTAGKRIVAVGLRGDIVYSDDKGKVWRQAADPVSSDLVAVSFVDDKNGWAVGHYGVVLHTADSGITWTKQLDGKSAAAMTAQYYAAKTGAERTPEVERAARQAKALVDENNTQSLLDVAFVNDREGYVVGTFNRIFRTEDGGNSWTPLMDRTDNPKELHFYSVHADGNNIYLTGEQGMIWHLDNTTNRFVAMQTPYNGTLFGMVTDHGTWLVYGMRGSLLRSVDAGKTWQRVHLDTQSGITSGAVLADGKIALADQAGSILLSSDHGESFRTVKTSMPMSYFGITPMSADTVALVGSEGIRIEPLL